MGGILVNKICFVCLGNIVRSPLAAALFCQQAALAGVNEKYEVDSAAVGPWHIGEAPDGRMRRVAARHGLIYDHRARQFQAGDLDRFDLILAMDRDNQAHLLSMARTPEQRSKIRLLREFDDSGGALAGVPDPYYDDLDGFEEVYAIVERSIAGLFRILENDDRLVETR